MIRIWFVPQTYSFYFKFEIFDQGDISRLQNFAENYGPFDIIIDDGILLKLFDISSIIHTLLSPLGMA